MDPVGHDRVRGAAGLDRWEGFLPSHAHAGGAARQPGWVAALTPLSVDGMIVVASTTLLADSRSGRAGGVLPWALLVAGSVASLAANVAVAEPTLIGRVIAARPSFALTASYELRWVSGRSARSGGRRRAATAGVAMGAGQPGGRTEHCLAARRLPGLMAAGSGGDGLSRTPTRLVPSGAGMHKNRGWPLMTGRTVHVLRPDPISQHTAWGTVGPGRPCPTRLALNAA